MKLTEKYRSVMGRIPLKFTIWSYFIIFTIIVFVLLWLFQALFFESFYSRMTKLDVAKTAEQITKSYESGDVKEVAETINTLAVKYNVCVEVLDKYGRSYTSKHVLGDCMMHGRENSIYKYLTKIHEGGNEPRLLIDENPRTKYKMIIYGGVLGSKEQPQGYLLINAALEPVGSTVIIIKRQLLIITAMLILLALVISLFMARRIARPIDRITESAEQLAKGDFETRFDGRGYLEVRTLAQTLTYAEKELMRVDTMQRDLIANVSHDLRTPLTMLKAYAEMIRDLSGDNPVKRNEHLGIIINETDRLSAMVNDILDLSKLESGKQKLSPSEFEIRDKLTAIIGRFKGISDQMGYSIHFTPDEERIVCCDVVKIEQVIYNLINNAINYTGADKQVFVRQINAPDGVIIEVEDTGDGIEEDKIKLIFDKYYRSENHKREVVGTGLGLSIVKAVLKLHGYDYGVRSVIGKGSTFWFKIGKPASENVQKNE